MVPDCVQASAGVGVVRFSGATGRKKGLLRRNDPLMVKWNRRIPQSDECQNVKLVCVDLGLRFGTQMDGKCVCVGKKTVCRHESALFLYTNALPVQTEGHWVCGIDTIALSMQ